MSRGWRWRRVIAGVLVLALLAVVSFALRPLSYADVIIRFGLWRNGVQSRYVTVSGLQLHYFEAEPKNGSPVLLVHGLGARGEDFGKLLPDLAKAGFHVYAPDLPGYGRSERPDVAYTIAYEEAAIKGFLDVMRLGRVDVVGWSMGGWISMRLAADHPERVLKLVLYDSAGVYFPLDYGPSLFLPTDAAGLDTLMTRLTPKPLSLPGFVQRDFLRRSAGNAWVMRRSLAAMTSGRDLMEFRLHEIKAPTVVMWGMSDRLIPPSAGRKIADGIQGAKFVPIDGPNGGCGHLAPAECEAKVLPATVEFLRQSGAEGSQP